MLNLTTLSRHLRPKTKLPNLLPGYKPSAVLVPLISVQNKLTLLFTERTDHVSHHKNQISFPGGVHEEEDYDLEATSLRESEEEIGLQPDQVQILGGLTKVYTPTRFQIIPYVGLITSKIKFQPNPQEIKSIIEVPLPHLLNPKYHSLEPNEFFGQDYALPKFHYQKHTIWGATARITLELLYKLKKIL